MSSDVLDLIGPAQNGPLGAMPGTAPTSGADGVLGSPFNDDDRLNPSRGIVRGIILSMPAWALVAWALYRLF